MPAERADYIRLFSVENGDVVSQVGTKTHMVATAQGELPARKHPFEYVPECFRLAVARLFFLGYGLIRFAPLPEKMLLLTAVI